MDEVYDFVADINYWLWTKSRKSLPLHLADDDLMPCSGVFPDPDLTYRCTRGIGHPGSHMAGTESGATVAVWDAEMAWCEARPWFLV